MSTEAGERSTHTGAYICENCGEAVRITEGEKIPTCPACGHGRFREGKRERGDQQPPAPWRKGD
jgi:DNA-directed RNA polymerase subunit RPC12/RpoP